MPSLRRVAHYHAVYTCRVDGGDDAADLRLCVFVWGDFHHYCGGVVGSSGGGGGVGGADDCGEDLGEGVAGLEGAELRGVGAGTVAVCVN